jgi:hypothetical protein
VLGICHAASNLTPSWIYWIYWTLALTFTQFTISQILPSAVSQLLLLLPFTPANVRLQLTVYSSQSHIATDGLSVSKASCRASPWGSWPNIITVWQLRSYFCEAPSLTRGRACPLYMLLALASRFFSGPSPLGLDTIFYCLRFETSLFVPSQGHGGGIRPRLHTGSLLNSVRCS